MHISKNKLELAAARKCQTLNAVRQAAKLDCGTFYKAVRGGDVRSDTVGRIAAALGIDAAEIVKGGA